MTAMTPTHSYLPLNMFSFWAAGFIGLLCLWEAPGWRAVVFTQGVLFLTCPHSLFSPPFHFIAFIFTLSFPFSHSHSTSPVYLATPHAPSLSSVVALPFLQIPASLLSRGLMFSFSAPSGNRDLCFGLSSNVTFSVFPALFEFGGFAPLSPGIVTFPADILVPHASLHWTEIPPPFEIKFFCFNPLPNELKSL